MLYPALISNLNPSLINLNRLDSYADSGLQKLMNNQQLIQEICDADRDSPYRSIFVEDALILALAEANKNGEDSIYSLARQLAGLGDR